MVNLINNQRTANYNNTGMPFYLYQTIKENVNIQLFERIGKNESCHNLLLEERVICKYLKKLMMFIPCEQEIIPKRISPRGVLACGHKEMFFTFVFKNKKNGTLQMSINIGMEKLIEAYL